MKTKSKDIVENLMKKYKKTAPYKKLLDLEDLAKKEGIKIIWVKEPFNIFDKNSFIGQIYTKNNQICIIINENSELNKTHTLAHLLGHFFLHKEIVKNNKIPTETPETFQRKAYYDFLEIEANQFASELLMPEKIVKSRWKKFLKISKNKETALKTLAESFNKTPLVMSYRLNDLGIN